MYEKILSSIWATVRHMYAMPIGIVGSLKRCVHLQLRADELPFQQKLILPFIREKVFFLFFFGLFQITFVLLTQLCFFLFTSIFLFFFLKHNA